MLLELKNIVAGYGNIMVLKGISLAVPEGKIVSLIGANGASRRLCGLSWASLRHGKGKSSSKELR